jgi:SAM-dependent methyltransferase
MVRVVSGEREHLRATFDEAAELYEQARPAYPQRLADDLVDLAGGGQDTSVLEVGCGTGQLTRLLAPRVGSVLCVELGERLAVVARRTLAGHANVDVVTADFEDWEPGDSSFDLVMAATAWHWIDPELRHAKAASVLAPGGALAVVVTRHVLPEGGDEFIATELQDAYRAVGEGDAWFPRPEEVDDETTEIESSGHFCDVRVRRYLVEEVYTADEYVSLLDTFSGHRVIEPGRREQLYKGIRQRIEARPEPVLRKHYLYLLHVARLRKRAGL